MVPSIRLLLAFAGLLTGCIAQEEQSCYFPNGTPHATGVPCNTSATDSHCCSARGLCLSNGLCFLQTPFYTNRIRRQSCTDRSWQSPSCPQYCADTYDGQDTTIWLGPENSNGAFCCGQPYNVTSEQCSLGTQGSTQPFNLPPGYVFFDREGKNSIDPAAFGLMTPSSSAAESATPSNTTALSAATAAVTETGLDSCNTTAVGAGVGVPLGVLLLIAVVLLIWQWRKSSALQKKLKEMKAENGTSGQEISQPHKDQPDNRWGGSVGGTASPAPAYAEPRKTQMTGHGIAEAGGGVRPNELPATQEVIPELGN